MRKLSLLAAASAAALLFAGAASAQDQSFRDWQTVGGVQNANTTINGVVAGNDLNTSSLAAGNLITVDAGASTISTDVLHQSAAPDNIVANTTLSGNIAGHNTSAVSQAFGNDSELTGSTVYFGTDSGLVQSADNSDTVNANTTINGGVTANQLSASSLAVGDSLSVSGDTNPNASITQDVGTQYGLKSNQIANTTINGGYSSTLIASSAAVGNSLNVSGTFTGGANNNNQFTQAAGGSLQNANTTLNGVVTGGDAVATSLAGGNFVALGGSVTQGYGSPIFQNSNNGGSDLVSATGTNLTQIANTTVSGGYFGANLTAGSSAIGNSFSIHH